MNLGTFTKQPAEIQDYDIDYSEWLTAGDNVSSVAVTILPATNLVLDSQYNNDPVVKLWFSGGTDGVKYKITVRTTTADGRLKEDEFFIKVKDL